MLLRAPGRVHDDAPGAALQDRGLGERVGAADQLPLGLVREDDVRGQLLQSPAEPLGPVGADRAPRGEVDADRRTLAARRPARRQRRLRDRLRQQRVAREMQPAAAGEPGHIELVGR